MRTILLPALVVLISSAAAAARPPDASPLPQARPLEVVLYALAFSGPAALNPLTLAGSSSASPIARAVTAALSFDTSPQPASRFAPDASPRPLLRPRPVRTTTTTPVAPAATPRRTLASLFGAKPAPRGAVCGDPEILGTTIATIPTTSAGCGLTNGVRVTSVAGISLSTAITVDCDTARALKSWVEDGIIPAIGRKGGGLARLEIAASYSCRPRNSVAGAQTSEHGRGHAVDVSGFTLANGTMLTVAQGWTSEARILRAAHSSACGTFGTVLGPKSDRYHRDHIHVDTARYRSGSYCR
jgi:hypothetical protein